MKPLLVACLSLLTFAGAARAEWTPPEKPDPHAIYHEAKVDASARRYEDALAKHLWFHENALKLKPSLRGVRLSFALSDWYDLGADYEPALAKFEEVRTAARKGALESTDKTHRRQNFIDFESMTDLLSEDQETVDLFLKLRDQNPDDAKAVYRSAQEALLKSDRFDVCGEFLDAKRAMELEIDRYKDDKEHVDKRHSERDRKFAERRFRNGAATIVLILAKNDRADEAQKIAQRARDVSDDEQLNADLDVALKGKKMSTFP